MLLAPDTAASRPRVASAMSGERRSCWALGAGRLRPCRGTTARCCSSLLSSIGVGLLEMLGQQSLLRSIRCLLQGELLQRSHHLSLLGAAWAHHPTQHVLQALLSHVTLGRGHSDRCVLLGPRRLCSCLTVLVISNRRGLRAQELQNLNARLVGLTPLLDLSWLRLRVVVYERINRHPRGRGRRRRLRRLGWRRRMRPDVPRIDLRGLGVRDGGKPLGKAAGLRGGRCTQLIEKPGLVLALHGRKIARLVASLVLVQRHALLDCGLSLSYVPESKGGKIHTSGTGSSVIPRGRCGPAGHVPQILIHFGVSGDLILPLQIIQPIEVGTISDTHSPWSWRLANITSTFVGLQPELVSLLPLLLLPPTLLPSTLLLPSCCLSGLVRKPFGGVERGEARQTCLGGGATPDLEELEPRIRGPRPDRVLAHCLLVRRRLQHV
mmetsp:Transcript_55987/g.128477  ORF Transcript_55987/g.128477 Transcript_55987/m.128477 type:complete len:436 (-) Transcript_55987:1009-2316(-)